MEQPRELLSLVSLYEQLRNELELDPESFKVPRPLRRCSGLQFASWMAGGFGGYISTTPWMGNPLFLLHNQPQAGPVVSAPDSLAGDSGRPGPCSGPGEGKLLSASRTRKGVSVISLSPGLGRVVTIRALIHPMIYRWPGSSRPTSQKAHKRRLLSLSAGMLAFNWCKGIDPRKREPGEWITLREA